MMVFMESMRPPGVSISMMMISVDTALRDAVSHEGEKEATIVATPDQIYGALSAMCGSPLFNDNNNHHSTSNFFPNPILKRALLKVASLAADQVSCRDLCRMFLRSDQSIAPTSWGLLVEDHNGNRTSSNTSHNRNMNTSNNNHNQSLSRSSNNDNDGLTAALQIELAQQKSLGTCE